MKHNPIQVLVWAGILVGSATAVAAAEPADYARQIEQVMALAEAEDYSAAIQLYEGLTPPDDFHYEHWYNLGVLLFDAERYRDAAAAFEEALEINPESGDALFNAGTAYLNIGDYTAAEDLLTRLVERAEDPRGYLNRGNARYAQGQLEPAAEDYRQALELNDSLPDAHYNYANLLYDREEWEAAEQAFTRAEELDPQFAEARFNRGNARMQLGLYEAARADYLAVLEMQPGNEDAQRNAEIAAQLIQQGDNE